MIQLSRETKETSIALQLSNEPDQPTNIETGLPFFDHMLEQLAKHSGLSLNLSVDADLEVCKNPV